jgi:hypothetical protein
MCITTGRLGFGQVKQPNRDVAQPGSALAWGARGREFESRHPDQQKSLRRSLGLFYSSRSQPGVESLQQTKGTIDFLYHLTPP